MAVQGVEETRHGKLLATMLDRYGLGITIPPAVGIETTQHAFVAFGYEECIDSFFGFGIFGLAKAIRLFHDSLFDIFEHVLLEETRHVVFFVNWIAYERARANLSAAPIEAALTTTGYLRAVGRLLAAFGPQASLPEDRVPMKQELGFAAAGVGDVIEGVTWRSFLQACVDENARRMADVDPRLLQPRVLPFMASAALAAPSRAQLLGKPKDPPRRLENAR